ncbi:hypothetical protein FS837_006025 [Tulasnella sp. UAMH 9824]|nr:hypothetical protein FS837_006025 [Tulasnella sp. UAMH 9824]
MTSPSSEGSLARGPGLSPVCEARVAPFKKRSRTSEGPGGGLGEQWQKTRGPSGWNAPKDLASAHIWYQNKVTAVFRKEHPELSHREVLLEIAKAWQNQAGSVERKGTAIYTV